MVMSMKKAYLVLSNGQVFEGWRFGAEIDAIGELVFTTGMVGYVETLADPCYYGQIVVQTFPLIGNCGVVVPEFEDQCCMKGYVVREWCDAPSNFRCEGDINAYLKEKKIPGIWGVDTRELTRIIRENGVMNAAICNEVPAELKQLADYSVTGAVASTTGTEVNVYPAETEERVHVAMLDLGAKYDYVTALRQRGCTVTVYPAGTSAEEMMKVKPDGVLLSDGPGDPMENPAYAEEVKKLIGKVPMFGIGLGHQLMAVAQGGRIEKMKYGHRGASQPVREVTGTRTFITVQNHGYVVDPAGMKGQVRFENANDGTCEGMMYPEDRCFSVQFRPEAVTGPLNTGFLFDEFVAMMGGTEDAAE